MQVFLASLSSLGQLPAKASELLWPQRRSKVAALAQEFDKKRCLVGGLMMRLVLKVEKDGDLTYGPYGRPTLNQKGPYFSLSHSGDWVALSVSLKRHGLDVEKTRTKAVPNSLAAKVLTDKELEFFKLHDSDTDLFVTLWTLKESFIKATGEGLARAFTSFSVLPLSDAAKTLFGSQWYFHQHQLPGATLALAVEGEKPEPLFIDCADKIRELLSEKDSTAP